MQMKRLWNNPGERDQFCMDITIKYITEKILMADLAKIYERNVPAISKYVSRGIILLAEKFGIVDREEFYKKNGYTMEDIRGISETHGVNKEVVIKAFEKFNIQKVSQRSSTEDKSWKTFDERNKILKDIALEYFGSSNVTIKMLAKKYGKTKTRIKVMLSEGADKILEECGLNVDDCRSSGRNYFIFRDVYRCAKHGGYSVRILGNILLMKNIKVYNNPILPSWDRSKFDITNGLCNMRPYYFSEVDPIMETFRDGMVYHDKKARLIDVCAVIYMENGDVYVICPRSHSYIAAKTILDDNGLRHIPNGDITKYLCTDMINNVIDSKYFLESIVEDYVRTSNIRNRKIKGCFILTKHHILGGHTDAKLV